MENNDISELQMIHDNSRVTSPAVQLEPVSSQGKEGSQLALPAILSYLLLDFRYTENTSELEVFDDSTSRAVQVEQVSSQGKDDGLPLSAIPSYLHLDFRIMENRDTSELGANDELLGMISGHFENQSRTRRRETAELPQLLVREDDEDDEDDELPEHRFVVQEGSGKITLFVGDNIFRRRYVR